MDKSTIIALTVLAFSIGYLLIFSGAKNTIIKLLFLATVLIIYFGSQYFFGPKGKIISLIILICYGVFAWKVKKIGSVLLWPVGRKEKAD